MAERSLPDVRGTKISFFIGAYTLIPAAQWRSRAMLGMTMAKNPSH